MPRLTGPALFGALAVVAFAARAQDAAQKPVVARALGSLPPEAAVKFVATYAKWTLYDARHRPELAGFTLDEAITAHCGSVQKGYREVLTDLNPGVSLPSSGALGADAYRIRWPACLRAELAPQEHYVVRPNDTLTGIRQRLTGEGAYLKGELKSFFASSNVRLSNARNLKPGKELAVALKTDSTLLVPNGLSAQAFASALSDTADGKVAASADVTSPGEIVGPVRFRDPNAPIGSTQGTFDACDRGDGSRPYPFDPAAVDDAYGWMLKSLQQPPARVTIVVVDNGFFGVPCSPAACPVKDGDQVAASPHFPRKLFDTASFDPMTGFGPVLSGPRIRPLNYQNHKSPTEYYGLADVNEDTGHGTHVAGLVLGGPSFELYRSVFQFPADFYWVRLVIANLSNGRRELLPGTERDLGDILQQVKGDKIVNMSVAFINQPGTQIGEMVKSAVTGESTSLFVVASGNEHKSLGDDSADAYPANLGGKDNNVITVASVDGPRLGKMRLSAFSNRSKDYVDIAAPGCRISSWIDSDRAIDESGTSQATPLVSFAAALLKALWNQPPERLKQRLIYSSDLLDDASDRDSVRSLGQLDIDKALTFSVDRVTFERGGVRRTLLGMLSAVQNLACDGGDTIAPANLRALKRAENGKVALYRVRGAGELKICWGDFSGGAPLSFTPLAEVKGGRIVQADPLGAPIQPAETMEVVLRY